MNRSNTAGMIDFWNDRPEPKDKFDEFLFALICLTDERGKKKPNIEVIDNWYQHARELFNAAVSEAVRLEIGKIKLRIIVERNDERI